MLLFLWTPLSTYLFPFRILAVVGDVGDIGSVQEAILEPGEEDAASVSDPETLDIPR